MRKHYLFQNGKIPLADNGKTVPFRLPEALTDYVINSGFVDKEDSEGDSSGRSYRIKQLCRRIWRLLNAVPFVYIGGAKFLSRGQSLSHHELAENTPFLRKVRQWNDL